MTAPLSGKPKSRRKGRSFRGSYAYQWSDEDYLARIYDRCVVAPTGCILWTGHTNACGYGEVSYRNRNRIITRANLAVEARTHPCRNARLPYVRRSKLRKYRASVAGYTKGKHGGLHQERKTLRAKGSVMTASNSLVQRLRAAAVGEYGGYAWDLCAGSGRRHRAADRCAKPNAPGARRTRSPAGGGGDSIRLRIGANRSAAARER